MHRETQRPTRLLPPTTREIDTARCRTSDRPLASEQLPAFHRSCRGPRPAGRPGPRSHPGGGGPPQPPTNARSGVPPGGVGAGFARRQPLRGRSAPSLRGHVACTLLCARFAPPQPAREADSPAPLRSALVNRRVRLAGLAPLPPPRLHGWRAASTLARGRVRPAMQLARGGEGPKPDLFPPHPALNKCQCGVPPTHTHTQKKQPTSHRNTNERIRGHFRPQSQIN